MQHQYSGDNRTRQRRAIQINHERTVHHRGSKSESNDNQRELVNDRSGHSARRNRIRRDIQADVRSSVASTVQREYLGSSSSEQIHAARRRFQSVGVRAQRASSSGLILLQSLGWTVQPGVHGVQRLRFTYQTERHRLRSCKPPARIQRSSNF